MEKTECRQESSACNTQATSESQSTKNAQPGKSPTTPKTRKQAKIFGLGRGITSDDAEITGSRLPTSRQVLRCMMFHLQQGASKSLTRTEAAKVVLGKVTTFYDKAHIPMISEIKACQKMIKLLDENAKLRAIPLGRRSTPTVLAKLKQMDTDLNKTFQLWPPNVETLIKIPEDLQFLQSMKTDRAATFGSSDNVLAAQIQRRQERALSEAARRQRADQEMAATASCGFQNFSSTDESSSENDMPGPSNSECPSTSTSTPRSHHRKRSGTSAFIPHNILQSPKLVSLATRIKMTPAQQAMFTTGLIEECGGDQSKVVTSYASADRARRQVGEEIAASCKELWQPPKLASLHWDSKLMPSLTNPNVSDERLTVAVGNIHEVKLLGVPYYKPGTDCKSGDIITERTVKTLDSWHCKDSICNMVFDTTASNTGHISAACVTMQKALQKPLLWSGCRHHVGEVILTHVFNDLQIEQSRSPEVTLFSRFRKNYDLLPYNSDTPLAGFNLSQFNDCTQKLVEEWKAAALDILKSQLDQKRDDYREFVQLCITFLDGTEGTKFKRPGALHKARWMAKVLYSIKICLLEGPIQQLPHGTITTKHQLPKLREFVTFATLIYSPWWLTCSNATDAPWNDLNLFQRLLSYEVVNPDISRSAIRAFKRHLWYLTAEMVPLSLFSGKVPPDEKQAMADRLLAFKPNKEILAPCDRFGTGFGKPRFPEDINKSTTLADLISQDSWFTLQLLQINTEFLTEKVDNWPHSPAYQSSAVNVEAINVVNDCAERGVKLSSDFLTASKTEEHYQNVLQVVEQDRKSMPNLRKRKSDTN